MASMASATVSLGSMESLGPGAGIGCQLVYSRPIPGCSLNDFANGNTCSTECVRGLIKIETALQIACGSLDADSRSVLGQALAGNLVGVLCNRVSPTPDKPISSSSTSSVAIPATTRTSSRPALTFTTVRPPSSTSSPVTRTDDESSTSEAQAPTRAESSAPTPESSTSSPAPEPTADDSDEGGRTGGGRTGGGSPFDPVRSSDSVQFTAVWTRAASVAMGLGLVLLLR